MKLHLTMKSGLIVATVGLLFTVTPAASQGRGTRKLAVKKRWRPV